MILPYDANPGRMEFSERTGQTLTSWTTAPGAKQDARCAIVVRLNGDIVVGCKSQAVLAYSVYTILGDDHGLVGIGGEDLTAAKDREIGCAGMNPNPPARSRSPYLQIVTSVHEFALKNLSTFPSIEP
jgi:hypothetical protein